MTLSTRLAHRLAGDGEFVMGARYWTGHLRIELDAGGAGEEVVVSLVEGTVSPGFLDEGDTARDVTLAAPRPVWDAILSPIPPPFLHDIVPAQGAGLRVVGDPETFWQYYPAVRRAVDLLRALRQDEEVEPA